VLQLPRAVSRWFPSAPTTLERESQLSRRTAARRARERRGADSHLLSLRRRTAELSGGPSSIRLKAVVRRPHHLCLAQSVFLPLAERRHRHRDRLAARRGRSLSSEISNAIQELERSLAPLRPSQHHRLFSQARAPPGRGAPRPARLGATGRPFPGAPHPILGLKSTVGEPLNLLQPFPSQGRHQSGSIPASRAGRPAQGPHCETVVLFEGSLQLETQIVKVLWLFLVNCVENRRKIRKMQNQIFWIHC
jgi:hypothetical protein